MKNRRAYYRYYEKNCRIKADRKEYQRWYEKHRKKRDRKKYYTIYNKEHWKKRQKIKKHEVEQNQFRGKTKMEVNYKGYVVKGTPQDIRELISGGISVADAKESIFGNTKKRKYVMSGKYSAKRPILFGKHKKYAKKKTNKLFVMTEAHKEAIRKGNKKRDKRNGKKKFLYTMTKTGRENIRKGMKKSWKRRNKR